MIVVWRGHGVVYRHFPRHSSLCVFFMASSSSSFGDAAAVLFRVFGDEASTYISALKRTGLVEGLSASNIVELSSSPEALRAAMLTESDAAGTVISTSAMGSSGETDAAADSSRADSSREMLPFSLSLPPSLLVLFPSHPFSLTFRRS